MCVFFLKHTFLKIWTLLCHWLHKHRLADDA